MSQMPVDDKFSDTEDKRQPFLSAVKFCISSINSSRIDISNGLQELPALFSSRKEPPDDTIFMRGDKVVLHVRPTPP